MGYYTLLKISIINKHNNIKNLEKLSKVVEDVSNYDFRLEHNYYDEKESFLIDENWNGGYGTKWYSFGRDIFEISERLPKLVILVEAKEENGRTWKMAVKGGDYYDSDTNEGEKDEDSEEDEENEDNEENEVDEENVQEDDEEEIINNNNSIGIEQIFQEMKINGDEIFRR